MTIEASHINSAGELCQHYLNIEFYYIVDAVEEKIIGYAPRKGSDVLQSVKRSLDSTA